MHFIRKFKNTPLNKLSKENILIKRGISKNPKDKQPNEACVQNNKKNL